MPSKPLKEKSLLNLTSLIDPTMWEFLLTKAGYSYPTETTSEKISLNYTMIT